MGVELSGSDFIAKVKKKEVRMRMRKVKKGQEEKGKNEQIFNLCEM